jgi:hypothetical protein
LSHRRTATIIDSLRRCCVERSWVKGGRISRFFAVLAFLAGLVPLLANAETDSERVEKIKSAFVLNIARFVSWPPEALEHQGTELLLCLYRTNPFGEAIKSIDGRTVSGRLLRLKLVGSLPQGNLCNILLIGGNEMQNFEDESRREPDRPLLTIADLTDTDTLPTHHPALVALVRNGSRIGFEINLVKARRVGLQMSANLLKLAKIVGDGN